MPEILSRDPRELLLSALEAAQHAKSIVETAAGEGREVTTAEQKQYDEKIEAATNLTRRARQIKADRDILAQTKALADLIDGPGKGGASGRSRGSSGRNAWASKSAATVHNAMARVGGEKAVVAGTIKLTNPLAGAEITPLGQVPTTVLDLLATDPSEGNTFTFLRQTVRTNNAAPVADGGLKPTSVYTIKEQEDRLRVVAHLSEAMPQRFFRDYSQLETFLEAEMLYGLRQAVEAQIVSGDGTGENLTGILNTSGILAQTAVTGDLLATVRKAVTALQVNGGVPGAFVMNPADAERFDLLREGAGTGQYLLGGPGSASEQGLWNIPRVASTSVAAGTAILGDWSYASLATKDDTELATDVSGDNFTHNLVTLRLEGRFGIAVTRPSAFVKITLPA